MTISVLSIVCFSLYTALYFFMLIHFYNDHLIIVLFIIILIVNQNVMQEVDISLVQAKWIGSTRTRAGAQQ